MKMRFPAYLLKLLLDPGVSRQKKIAFPLIVGVYWIMPDLLPFIPLDDLLVTALMTYWFTRSAEKDLSQGGNGVKGGTKEASGEYVDVKAEVLDDDVD